jgi:hypothetical protein
MSFCDTLSTVVLALNALALSGYLIYQVCSLRTSIKNIERSVYSLNDYIYSLKTSDTDSEDTRDNFSHMQDQIDYIRNHVDNVHLGLGAQQQDIAEDTERHFNYLHQRLDNDFEYVEQTLNQHKNRKEPLTSEFYWLNQSKPKPQTQPSSASIPTQFNAEVIKNIMNEKNLTIDDCVKYMREFERFKTELLQQQQSSTSLPTVQPDPTLGSATVPTQFNLKVINDDYVKYMREFERSSNPITTESQTYIPVD